MRTITLTTDFGTRDWFVGTMKGVILEINSKAAIIDITHEVAAGNIRSGAFALMASSRYFPKGTVHVAVIDPGVGSEREAIAIETTNYFFVGPNNGVLSFALKNEKVRSVHRLENDHYFLNPVSHTFHGRDVFAPIAAHLSRGAAISKFGPKQKEIVRLRWPKPEISRNRIRGEVIYIDQFGNAITNIPNSSLSRAKKAGVFIRARMVCDIEPFYQSVPAGTAVAVPGSTGFLEIAINGGSAAKSLKLEAGAAISIR